MIDWYSVFTNTLWITAAGALAASFSWHAWEAGEVSRPLREVLSESVSWQACRSATLTVICLSQACSRHRYLWERVAWSLPMAWFAVECAKHIRASARRERSPEAASASGHPGNRDRR